MTSSVSKHQKDSGGTRSALKCDLDGRPIVLAFSAGKDSLAAWLTLRAEGFDVRPVYRYLVPGLSFVERGLTYYEEFFGREIKRVPHASLARWLRHLIYQAPQNCETLEAYDPLEPTQEDGSEIAARAWGLELGATWIATGVRACDSPLRRIAIAKHGAVNHTLRQAMVVWDWTKADVMASIRCAGAKLPPDYRLFGRSFDGLDARFLVPIARHYPEDYARILEWFPLSELEVRRHGWQEARRETRGASR